MACPSASLKRMPHPPVERAKGCMKIVRSRARGYVHGAAHTDVAEAKE